MATSNESGAVERTAAIDLVLGVAVGVEGLSQETTQWDGTQYEWRTHVSKHDLESERLGGGSRNRNLAWVLGVYQV